MTKRPWHRARRPSRSSAPTGQNCAAPHLRRLRAELLEDRCLLTAGPRVVFSSVLEDGVLSSGTGSIIFVFDDDLDDSVLDVTDVNLIQTDAGSETVPVTDVIYLPVNRALVANFSPPAEGSYQLTLYSAADAFVDTEGNLLDGEPNPLTTIPSGDGMPGGDFVVNFFVDSDVTDFPTPLNSVGPRGGLIYESTSEGILSFAGDVDSFSIDVDAGQTLSVLVEPLGPSLDPELVLKGPSGTPVAAAQSNTAGQYELIQTFSPTVSGTYVVDVSSTSGTGAFRVRLVMNAAIEEEPYNGESNDTYGTAVNLDGAFVTLADDSVRAAVVGRLAQESESSTDEDWYALPLSAGESATLAVEGEDADVTVELFFQDYLLATGTTGGTNVDSVIHDFTFFADATFHVRVSGAGATDYSLIVTRNADFSVESNFSFDAAQDISASGGALGYVLDSLEGIETIEPIGEGPVPLVFDFPGPADNRFIPPDPTAAAGPEQIVTIVNTTIAIYDKETGAELFVQDLSGADGFFGETGAVATVFDPWVVYDWDSERFFAIGVEIAATNRSNIYLAVSTDSTPSSGEDWYKYQFNFTDFPTVLGSGAHFPDYPKMAVNGDAVWISGNYFAINAGSGRYAGLTAIDKAAVLTGAPATILYEETFNGFSVFPVQQYGDADVQYFVSAPASGGNSLTVHAVHDVLTAPVRTTTSVSVPNYGQPVNVPQLGGGKAADSIDARIMTGVWRDGSIWVAHAITDPAAGDGESAARWYEIDAAASGLGTPSLVQSGTVDPGPGLHAWMPSIAVDGAGNMAIGFSLGGTSIYYAAGYTGRLASDPPGTTILPVGVLHDGEHNYVAQDDRGRNRWGDYSGLSIDPVDDATFWVFNEYASATPNRWATHVGAFQLAVPLDEDWYQFSVIEGDALELAVFIPAEGGGQFFNGLESLLELYDAEGNFVVSDTGSGSISHTALASGNYRLRVRAAPETAGEYFVNVSGNTGGPGRPNVVDADPDDGQVLPGFPTTYTLDFSQPLYNLSVDAGDVLIGGLPALSVVAVDGDTYEFEIDPSANAGDGEYSVVLAANRMFSLQYKGNEAFVGTFTVDTTGPRVLETALNGQPYPIDGTITAGPFTFEARFNEELSALASARRGPLSPGADDVQLIEHQTGASFTPAVVTYDPDTGTFTAEYGFLPEGNYTLTLVSGDSAFEDLVGNDLDGEPLGPAPDGTISGDGTPGGDYVIDFYVDRAGFATAEFDRVEPLGGLIFVSLDNTGLINTPADVDSFELFLQEDETITAVVVPDDPTAKLSVEIMGLVGVVHAVTPGEPVILPIVSIDSDGTYEVRVGSDTATAFTLDLYRNAAVEVSDSGDGAELAIDGSLIGAEEGDLPPSYFLPGRYAVVGTSDPDTGESETAGDDVDEYTLDLTGFADRRLDIVLAGHDGVDFSSAAQLELLDTDGINVLRTAEAAPYGNDPTNLDLAILDFTVPDDGVYTLRVTSPVVGRYSIVVTQSLAFELEPHLAGPTRDLTDVGWAVGFIEAEGESAPPGDGAIDLFQIEVLAGQTLVVQTDTPFDSASSVPGNSLDPTLVVLDPSGHLFGFDYDSAPDGKNAQLVGLATASGTYTIGVVGLSGRGEYLTVALVLDETGGDFPSGGGSAPASLYDEIAGVATKSPSLSFPQANSTPSGADSVFDMPDFQWLLHDFFAELLHADESGEETSVVEAYEF